MSWESHELFGPVTALFCSGATTLFGVGNTIYRASDDALHTLSLDRMKPSAAAVTVAGRLPDGCVVTTVVACPHSLVVASSADTLFLLVEGTPALQPPSRIVSAHGARFVRVTFDHHWNTVVAIAADGNAFLVPLGYNMTETPCWRPSSSPVTVRAFDAGVLLAGAILCAPAVASGRTRTITFFGATYAGTVIESSLSVPDLNHSKAGEEVGHAFAVAARQPLTKSAPLVAHRAGCAIFTVSTLVVPSTGYFLATCSDDRSVALFHRRAGGDVAGAVWSLVHRFQGTVFARCRVFDVCLAPCLVAGSADVGHVLCGMAGEDGTVQAFRIQQPQNDACPTVEQVLYRPLQHDGHGVWRVGFVSGSEDGTGQAQSLVSAGFDGVVARHPCDTQGVVRLDLADLGLTRGGQKKANQVRCVGVTEGGLVVCCTARELILHQPRRGDNASLHVPLATQDNATAAALPTTLTSVFHRATSSATDDVQNCVPLLVIGTDRGTAVLVTVQLVGDALRATQNVSTTLAHHNKWLHAAATSWPSPRVASCHLDGTLVVCTVQSVCEGSPWLCTMTPLFQCANGPGRALTALHVMATDAAPAGGGPDRADSVRAGCWLLCGDKRGTVCGYWHAATPSPRDGSVATIEETSRPFFTERVFGGGQSVSAFCAADDSGVACTVFAADGLYVHLSLSCLAPRPCTAGAHLPLRLPAKATNILAASREALAVQHATSVAVYRRSRDGTMCRSDWVQVALYENVKAPRLVSAVVSPGSTPVVYLVHCSDGVTLEVAECGTVAAAQGIASLHSESQLLRGRAVAGKDFNACLFVKKPFGALLCAGEDTGLAVLRLNGASQSVCESTTLYGPHHSNILALCALPPLAGLADGEVSSQRVVTVGGLATVVVWDCPSDALWRVIGASSEENAQDPGSADRIPRFLAVCALGSTSVAIGSSDGTVRQYELTLSGDGVAPRGAPLPLNATHPKPILALGRVLPTPVPTSSASPSIVAGDTNGHVYVLCAEQHSELHPAPLSAPQSSLHVERSAVNALSEAHVVQRRGSGARALRFISLHDSGTAYLVGGDLAAGGLQLHHLSRISTGITAGRGVSWQSPAHPSTLVSEDAIVCVLWRTSDGDAYEPVTLTRRRPNVRCVSGLAVSAPANGKDTLVAVVGQGVEVVREQPQTS